MDYEFYNQTKGKQMKKMTPFSKNQTMPVKDMAENVMHGTMAMPTKSPFKSKEQNMKVDSVETYFKNINTKK